MGRHPIDKGEKPPQPLDLGFPKLLNRFPTFSAEKGVKKSTGMALASAEKNNDVRYPIDVIPFLDRYYRYS